MLHNELCIIHCEDIVMVLLLLLQLLWGEALGLLLCELWGGGAINNQIGGEGMCVVGVERGLIPDGDEVMRG